MTVDLKNMVTLSLVPSLSFLADHIRLVMRRNILYYTNTAVETCVHRKSRFVLHKLRALRARICVIDRQCLTTTTSYQQRVKLTPWRGARHSTVLFQVESLEIFAEIRKSYLKSQSEIAKLFEIESVF